MSDARKATSSALAILLLIVVAAPARADDRLTLRPDYLRIRSLAYAGSGCPAGTVAENVSPDNQAFTLIFDNYIAEVGPGIPLSQKRKNCQIIFDFDYPSGWQFALLSLDIRGFYSLERGVAVTQQSRFYFQGDANTRTLATTVYGPMDQDYMVRDRLGLASQVFSPCGASRALNVNTSINMTTRGRQRGLFTIDSIDGYTAHVYSLEWRRC